MIGVFRELHCLQKSERLKERHNLTQTEISEILHCSQRVYSNYERGEIEIPTSVLIALADYYRSSGRFINPLF